MKLQYDIRYKYDYESRSCLIVLSSDYVEKEYSCASIANLSAMLGVAIEDFNKLHAEKIQELEDEEKFQAYQAKQKSKPSSPKSEG